MTSSKTEESLASLVEGLPIGVYRTTPDGTFLAANPAMASLVGYPDPASLLAINVKELYVDPEQRRQWLERMEQTGVARGFELRLRHLDGHVIWVENNARAVRDANGHIVCCEGSIQDISQRKLAENALRYSETELRALLQAIPDMMFRTTAEAVIIDYKAARDDDLYVPPEVFLGKRVDEVLPPHVAGPIVEKLAVAQRSGEAQTLEYTLEIGGVPLNFEARIVPVGDSQLLAIIRDITPQTRSLEMLRESEEQYRTTLESMADPLHVVDSDLRIVLMNEAFRSWGRELGITEDTIGKTIFEVYPFLSPKVRDEYAEVFATGRTLTTDDVVHVGERRLYTDTRKIPVFEGKQVIRVVTTVRDVTERKVAEEALAHSMARLEALHAMDVAVLAARSPREIAAVALPPVRRLVGCERASVVVFDEVAGEAEHLAVDAAEGIGLPTGTRAPLRRHATEESYPPGGVYYNPDLPVPHEGTPPSDGQPSLVLRSAVTAPLFAEGRLIGVFSLASTHPAAFTSEHREIAREVGDQLAVALHDGQLQLRLEAEQRRLAALVEQLPDGVVLLDGESRVVLANSLGRQYLALLDPGLLETRVEMTRPELRGLLDAETGGAPREIVLTNGELRVFEARARSVVGVGSSSGWVLIIREVTAEKRVASRLEQENRLAVFGQLAGGLAHDLNNILTTIVTYPEMLLRQPQLDARIARALGVILDQGQRGASLVRQMLDFCRQSSVERRPVSLLQFVHDTARILDQTLPESIAVRTQISIAEDAAVNADPIQLQQILMNLAVNARDAMPGGGTLTLAIDRVVVHPQAALPLAGMTEGEWFRIAVTDTGCGIAPADLPHVFEPFFTTKPHGQGTGLGLSQVHGLMQQHGGFTAIDSTPGIGTSVQLYLPAFTGVPQTPIEIDRTLPLGSGETILLTEDEPQVRETLRETLVFLGYRVLDAGNGREALAIIRSGRLFDLLLTDVTMPEMSGVELVRAARQIVPGLRAVALTGHLAESLRGQLEAAGVAEIMQKPTDIEHLATMLRRVLYPPPR